MQRYESRAACRQHAASFPGSMTLKCFITSKNMKKISIGTGAGMSQERRLHRSMSESHADKAETTNSAESVPSKRAERMSRHGMSSLLVAINRITKWSVSATAIITALILRDDITFWCIIGSILSVILCKLIKVMYNEARPSGSPKLDPGMPSSHANSLSFLSSYIATLAFMRSSQVSHSQIFFCLGIPLVAAFLAWLRWALGYHSLRQVLAGWMLGTATGVSWAILGINTLLPLVERYDCIHIVVPFAASLLGTGFMLYTIRSLMTKTQDRHHKRI